MTALNIGGGSRRFVWTALLLIAACPEGEAMADDTKAMLKAKGCVNCHDETKVRIGPSFTAMAQRRTADPAGTLAIYKAKLIEAKGHPATTMTEAEVDQLTQWILGLAAGK